MVGNANQNLDMVGIAQKSAEYVITLKNTQVSYIKYIKMSNNYF
jgi:hypothetical protein